MIENSTGEKVQYAVVGAGPAGLQVGYFLAKAGVSYVVLEREAGPGAFFHTYPRHRKLISINKVHCGTADPEVQFRWDWNSLLNDEGFLFKKYSSEYFPAPEALIDYLRDFALSNRLNVRYLCPVHRLRKIEDGFELQVGDTWLVAEKVVFAGGLTEPYFPNVPGIHHASHYANFDTDPQKFVDRSVLIIGKGNSAFETAESLIPFAARIHVVSPSNVRMAWNTHHVGNLRAVNNNLIDTDRLKGQNATIWGDIKSVEKDRARFVVRIAHTDSGGRIFSHVYDDLICCTGLRMSLKPFAAGTVPELTINGRFPQLTERWESTNVPGLFFAGTLGQSRDFKKSSSAFIHGFRYNARALVNFLMQDCGSTWPSLDLGGDAESITNALMRRINTTSSLWHQFNFISDVVDITDDKVKHYRDLPTDYVLASPQFRSRRFLLLTFTHDKPADAELAKNFSHVPALHPRFKLFENGREVSEHHMLEDLEAEWFEETLYISPLQAYVTSALARIPNRSFAAS